MANQQIAQTILQQLGGGRFVAMTGSKDFVGSDDGLRFKVGRGARNGITHVKVTLCASDTYRVEASKYSPRSLKVITLAKVEGVQVEGLRQAFTAMTGFETRL